MRCSVCNYPLEFGGPVTTRLNGDRVCGQCAKKVYNVKTVKIINIGEALKVIDPNDELTYKESGEKLMDYCTLNHYGYYAKPGDQFCIVEAAREALEAGFRGVVVEDMS